MNEFDDIDSINYERISFDNLDYHPQFFNKKITDNYPLTNMNDNLK